jgi:hypothetical protein
MSQSRGIRASSAALVMAYKIGYVVTITGVLYDFERDEKDTQLNPFNAANPSENDFPVRAVTVTGKSSEI